MKTAGKLFVLVATLSLSMALIAVAPMSALASEKPLTTAKASLTTQASSNPYIDVNKNTVDKKGIDAVKYVKKHQGFKGVINGQRFYPGKGFSQAQFTKILRNLYGNKVTLSKSKTTVTGKWACAQLQTVAKKCFGVKIKWTSGATAKKLTRVGVSNYIKVFATWQNGLFKPKH